MTTKSPLIGVDFLQARDYTAISVGYPEDNTIQIRYLERLPLGERYEDQIEQIKAVFASVQSDSGMSPRMIVDHTGVGRAVVEMIQKAGFHPIMVTVTGGGSHTKEGCYWKVPKKELVSPLIVGIQNKTVLISKGLQFTDDMKKELQNFKLKINIATGNESFEAWREQDHDDLVFATALVVYGSKNTVEPGVVKRQTFPSKYNGRGDINVERQRRCGGGVRFQL
jgi:hypothetical protein